VARKDWRDRTPGQRRAVRAMSVVQLALAAAAWIDLWRRPPATVVGRKVWWAFVIAINFVGPLTYLRWGRRPSWSSGPAATAGGGGPGREES